MAIDIYEFDIKEDCANCAEPKCDECSGLDEAQVGTQVYNPAAVRKALVIFKDSYDGDQLEFEFTYFLYAYNSGMIEFYKNGKAVALINNSVVAAILLD